MFDEVGNERVRAGGVVRRVGQRQDVLSTVSYAVVKDTP